jgi:hypothetical protein
MLVDRHWLWPSRNSFPTLWLKCILICPAVLTVHSFLSCACYQVNRSKKINSAECTETCEFCFCRWLLFSSLFCVCACILSTFCNLYLCSTLIDFCLFVWWGEETLRVWVKVLHRMRKRGRYHLYFYIK